MWIRLLCLLGLLYLGDGVTVKVGSHTFSLEAVKQYKQMMEKSHVAADPTHHTEQQMCGNKELPSELQEVCHGTDTNEIMKTFGELGRISGSMDKCEVCAIAACTGCW
ncbi:guanylin [Rana temporaria]|uniref:guanylin n=1 Tax=Rana temporaria TaxID=8407 RepID=UPI001AADF478|nr:guanylin [Rana temporaria]